MLQFYALTRFLLSHFTVLFRGACGVLILSIALVATAAPGQLDPTFGNGSGYVTTPIGAGLPTGSRVALYPGNKIVVAGSCNIGGTHVFCVARYQSDGTSDNTFGQSGIVSLSIGNVDDFLTALLVQANGKVLATGSCGFKPDPLSTSTSYNFCMVRFDTDGTMDVSFGTNGTVITALDATNYGRGVATQTDGKLVLAGSCGDLAPNKFCIARYFSSGALDVSFGANGKVITDATGTSAAGVLIQSDQKIVLFGGCASNGYVEFCARRYLSNGLLDGTFGANGKVIVATGRQFVLVEGGLLQADGKIVLSGACSDVSGQNPVFCLARIATDGQPDPSFGTGGNVVSTVYGDNGFSVMLQPDGKLVVVGRCSAKRMCLVRYSTDGAIDPTFDGGRVLTQIGRSAMGYDLVLQPDGNILASGVCTDEASNLLFCLARYQGGPYLAQACALNADANNTIESSTDALLILRYLLGYRGDTLTNGALGANPTRTGAALETYLASLNLDVDGDGQAHAMTDGLLILRAMLGLSGNALTAGAVNTSSPTVRNAQQILTWIETTHGVACLP